MDDGGILYPVFRDALALLDDAYDNQKRDGKRILHDSVVSAADGMRRRGLYAVSCGDGLVYDLIKDKKSADNHKNIFIWDLTLPLGKGLYHI